MSDAGDGTLRCCWVYQVTPVYAARHRDRGDPETVVDQVCLGRKQLGTLWWKGCTCLAYLPESTYVCKKTCRPLRRNVQFLSRRLLALDEDMVSVHPDCKYPDLITVQRLTQTGQKRDDGVVVTFDVAFGKGKEQWMRFLIDAVPTMSEATMPKATGNKNPRVDPSIDCGADTEAKRSLSASRRTSRSRQPITPSTSGTSKKRKRTGGAHELRPKSLSFSEESSEKMRDGELFSQDDPISRLASSTENDSNAALRNCISPSLSTPWPNQITSPRTECRRRLWSTETAAVLSASQERDQEGEGDTMEGSYLSLPMPAGASDNESSSRYASLSMQEETQYYDWTADIPLRPCPARCDSLSIKEWRDLQRPSTQSARTFRETMIDLVVHQNDGKGSQESLWLPDILKDATLG